jgi:hypothetical protein
MPRRRWANSASNDSLSNSEDGSRAQQRLQMKSSTTLQVTHPSQTRRSATVQNRLRRTQCSRHKSESFITREVGGRSLLGPLRRSATAQAIRVRSVDRAHSRAVLRFATASGAPRVHQRASPSLLPPTSLTWVKLRVGGGNVQTPQIAMECSNDTTETKPLPSFTRVSQLAFSREATRFSSSRTSCVSWNCPHGHHKESEHESAEKY